LGLVWAEGVCLPQQLVAGASLAVVVLLVVVALLVAALMVAVVVVLLVVAAAAGALVDVLLVSCRLAAYCLPIALSCLYNDCKLTAGCLFTSCICQEALARLDMVWTTTSSDMTCTLQSSAQA